MNLEDSATVRRLSGRVQEVESQQPAEAMLNGAWLRRLAFYCSADDVGLVEFARLVLDPQRDEIPRNYPWTKSLLSLVLRMARDPVRGAPRSVTNLELHRAGRQVNEISAAIVAKLEARGVRAINPSMGFPWRGIRPRGHAILVV